MKTQIIQLEPHDDTLSVRDKMDWSQAPRVLLVWPEKSKVLRTRLDLILLERYSSSHGSQLGVLTTDRQVIYQAESAGIPVFQSRSEAQLQPWRKSFRDFQRQEIEKYAAENLPEEPFQRAEHKPRERLPLWARIPLFTLSVLSVLILAAFLLPSAEVTILPEIRERSLDIPVQAQPGRTQITLSGMVPARELSIIVEGQLSTATTGSIPVPAEYAQGEVLFTNLGEEGISIPQDTILSTTGEMPILFRTLTGGQTPQEQGGQILLAVEAFLPGESGNIPADQITRINLEAGADLVVTNPMPTNGGSDILVPAPTLADRLRLSREMTQLLNDQALEEIERELGAGDYLLTQRLNDFEVIKDEFSPQEDAPGDLLWLDRSLRYQLYYISGDDLHQLASNLVQAQYQDSSFKADFNSIQLQPASSLEKQGEAYYGDFRVSWEDSQLVNQELIRDWIFTKSVGEAKKILLDNLDLEEVPQIDIQPSWWPRVPALPFRIQVIQGGI